MIVLSKMRKKVREGQFAVSRFIFGNDVQFSYNLSGFRRLPKIPYNAGQLRRNGFVIFDQAFEQVEQLQQLSDKLDNFGVNSPRSLADEVARKDISLTDDEQTQILSALPSNVREEINLFYGSREHRIGRCDCWQTLHVKNSTVQNGEIGSAYYWHTDRHRTDLVKMFVYLSDVTDSNGPLTFLDINNTKKFYRSNFIERNSIKNLNLDGQITFKGNMGSVALVRTTNCLHRAGIPSPKMRRNLLQFSLYAA